MTYHWPHCQQLCYWETRAIQCVCTLLPLESSQEPIAQTRWPSVIRQWLWPAAMLVTGGRPMTSMATTPPDLNQQVTSV